MQVLEYTLSEITRLKEKVTGNVWPIGGVTDWLELSCYFTMQELNQLHVDAQQTQAR